MTNSPNDFGPRIANASPRLEILREVPGRALLAQPDGSIYIGRSYDILRSKDEGRTWSHITSMPRSLKRRLAEPLRLTRRLLRQEIRALLSLSSGRLIAANREGVFISHENRRLMTPCEIDHNGTPVNPPMRLAIGPDDTVVWGEYGSRKTNGDVRIFASTDEGMTFHCVYTFPDGEIRHIHNISYNSSDNQYWVMTGDYGDAAGIGKLSADFTRFEWVRRGHQRYRAVEVFHMDNRLLYATDTEKEKNRFVLLDKANGTSQEFGSLPGSCLHACRFGEFLAISTSVEPSEVNPSNWASLWLSRDGRAWTEVYRAEKDRWHPRYFQYGSMVLPSGESTANLILFSGQALKGIDAQTIIAKVTMASSI